MPFCDFCPRRCPVNREEQAGFCGAGRLPRVARAMLHQWEEPPISGTRGAGAVFFSGCNLRCVFCQNSDISARIIGTEMDEQALSDLFLRLEQAGAHNVDLVTPTPHANVLASAIALAKKRGLTVPVIWNSNAYENVEMLKRLEGLVDVYLPDLKYVSEALSKKYSAAADYFAIAGEAIKEMARQTGPFETDGEGIAKKGTLVRHLVLPGSVDDTRKVIDFLADELGDSVRLSLMRQYTPMYAAVNMPFLNRRLTKREYERAVEHALSRSLQNVFIQKGGSADAAYTPAFDGSLI
ncbi:MAG: radical SAM protein [Christensenellales bacterium]|jgi:putative pyruvate formate lyase activating enzyme